MIEQIHCDDDCKIRQVEKQFPSLFTKKDIPSLLFDNKFTQIYILSISNQIIGCMILDIIYERMELIQIEIVEEKRNQGFGKQLMEFMISLARQQKLENITLEVRRDNVCAIHLYQEYKFQIVALRRKYYGDTDGYLMERKMIEDVR